MAGAFGASRGLIHGLLALTIPLLACGGPQPKVARPRPTPPRPRTVDDVERMRAIMAGWARQLRRGAATGSVELRDLLTIEPGGAKLPHRLECTGSGKRFDVVTTQGLDTPRARGTRAPLPALFAYSAGVPPKKSPGPDDDGPVPPSACLVFVAQANGRLSLVAEPVPIGQDVGEVRFARRGRCLQLELTTRSSKTDSVRGETEKEESLELHAVGPERSRALGTYGKISSTGGHGNYSASGSGMTDWVEVGGRHYLVYRFTNIEMSYHDNFRPKERKVVSVERLTRKCALSKIDALELERLRKLPGGGLLPKALLVPQTD